MGFERIRTDGKFLSRIELEKWDKENNSGVSRSAEEYDNMYLLQQLRKFYYEEFDLPITEESLIKEGFKWEELTDIDDDGQNEPEIFKYQALVKDGYALQKDHRGNFYRSYSLGCMGWNNVELKNFQDLQINYIADHWYHTKLNHENFK